MTPTDLLPEMPCAEFVERVTEYLEHAMGDDDRRRLELHLTECASCSTYLEQLHGTLRLVGKLREGDVTPAMHGDLLRAFSRWRQEA